MKSDKKRLNALQIGDLIAETNYTRWNGGWREPQQPASAVPLKVV